MLTWPMTAAAETTNVLTEVAGRLRTLRTERGMTLIELSKATGISKSTLSRLETRRPFGAAGDQPVEVLSLLSRPGERAHIRAAPRRKNAR